MIVYTVLFTLDGKNPADNRYVEMFYIWLSHVLKNGGLGTGDKICILIDKPTIDFLNTEFNIGFIINTSVIPIEFYAVKSPQKISEGMSFRYSLDEYPMICNECSLYIDLDVIVVSPLQVIREVSNDTIMAVVEGYIENDDYGGKVLPTHLKNNEYPGFTSAIFAFSVGEEVKSFMRKVKNACLMQDPPFYTVDQPFFNKYIYEELLNKKRLLYILPKTYVTNNTMIPSETAIFKNYSGSPGNGSKHVVKLIMMMCSEILIDPPTNMPPYIPLQKVCNDLPIL